MVAQVQVPVCVCSQDKVLITDTQFVSKKVRLSRNNITRFLLPIE